MLCPNCEEEMHEMDVPSAVFRVGPWELWHWRKEFACVECEMEREREKDRRIYDVGFDDGVAEVFKHRCRE